MVGQKLLYVFIRWMQRAKERTCSRHTIELPPTHKFNKQRPQRSSALIRHKLIFLILPLKMCFMSQKIRRDKNKITPTWMEIVIYYLNDDNNVTTIYNRLY